MTFGPTNAPRFYSAMIRNFKEEWDLLFTQMLRSTDILGNSTVAVMERDKHSLNKTNLVSGSRTNIDYILIFSSNLESILIYLEFVCKFFLNIESASDLKM